jgi:hypothetical protein
MEMDPSPSRRLDGIERLRWNSIISPQNDMELCPAQGHRPYTTSLSEESDPDECEAQFSFRFFCVCVHRFHYSHP